MDFEVGSRYRHVNCLDTDIQIDHKFEYPNSRYYLVSYYNRHWQNGDFLIHSDDLVQFNDREASRWLKIK